MPKKNHEKLTIEQYQELKARRAKQFFRFDFYPWPVTIFLLIPFSFLLLIIVVYVCYIKWSGN